MTIRGSFLRCALLPFLTLFLCSCITTDKKLGDYLVPSDQHLILNTTTFDLPIYSRPTDSLQTSNLFVYESNLTLLFGACQDPIFGLTKAGSVFQFIPWSSFSYGDFPEPVSLTLTLIRSTRDNIVLDMNQTTAPQTIFVHEVLTDLSYKYGYNNSLLTQDWEQVPISKPGQLYFGTDTIKVSLSLDFARKLLTATQEERDTASLFKKRFKGLYIQTESPVGGNNAGRINRALLSSAEMVLKYTLDGADSTLYYSSDYYGHAFNSITHSNAEIDPNSSKNIYYQGFAGIKPYIDFVSLTHSIRTWAEQSQIDVKNLLISRAEVLIAYDPAIDYTKINQYPPLLYPFTRAYTDSTAYYRIIDNIYLSPPEGNVNINRSKYHYSLNITSYLQSLLKKEEVTERDNTWLMETTSTIIDDYGTSMFHHSSSSYPLALLEGTSSDAKPILKLTYTVLK
ncbi:MAG: DUF4270 domain-containing protein [Prevotellaceae bacterium]|jgi:hypothetical protein|nr:DUF4270 domain-containing protein [Prevotellaceae bacterium]